MMNLKFYWGQGSGLLSMYPLAVTLCIEDVNSVTFTHNSGQEKHLK